MAISVIILLVWFVLGAVILIRKDDPTPFEFACMWFALIATLIKEVFEKM